MAQEQTKQKTEQKTEKKQGMKRMPGWGFDTNDLLKHYRSVQKDDMFILYRTSDIKMESPLLQAKISNNADSVSNYIYLLALLRAILNYEYCVVQDNARHKLM